MSLPKYLKSVGLVTGPRAHTKNTSHSGMDVLRRNLLGIPLFVGGEHFLHFGVALHEAFLEGKYGEAYEKLSPSDKALVDKLVDKLKAHPVVMRLYNGSIREEKKYKELMGVLVAYILDIMQPQSKIGADLKTTACTTFQDCLKKAILYGYHKQRHLYKEVEGLREFYFIFISKKYPHDIFIIGDKDFKPYESYAKKEVEWLLYVYKNYGKFGTEEETQNTTTNMTDKAKKLLTQINDAVKAHKTNLKEKAKAEKQVADSKKKVLKLINSFPKNEAPLHKDKFDKAIMGL